MKKKRIEELTITDFTKKGDGLAYLTQANGSIIPVEVPFTMPNDKVKALLLRKRKGHFLSLLDEVAQPCPERIIPRCIHFSICGGCRWQHIAYPAQLKLKEELIYKSFASMISPNVNIYPIIECTPPWQYRNKLELTCSSNADKKNFLGMVINGSRGKAFNLTECHLVSPWFSEAVQKARSWWDSTGIDAYHPFRNTGSLRTLTLREGERSGDRMVMLTVSGNPDYALTQEHLKSFVLAMRETLEPVQSESKLSIFVRIQQIVKGQPTNFFEMHLYGPDHMRETLFIKADQNEEPVQLFFQISPSAFFQPSTRQAEQLYSRALQLADIPENGVVYDLYCGTGTLGICAALKAKQVVGIEISPESSLDARTNATLNNVKNVQIMTGDVGKVLSKLIQENQQIIPDLVMVDPPRVGLDEKALQSLIQLSPPKILYISCNPVTQAENCLFLRNKGYELEAIQPVDQFPQTVHVENIVILRKRLF